MSEELIQRDLLNPDSLAKMGDWPYYSIGSMTLSDLKKAKIIPDIDYLDLELKKPDVLIGKWPEIIAAIEYKRPAQLRTEKQIKKAIDQEIEVAKAINALLYIVTDGSQKTIWLNPKTGNLITRADGTPIDLAFSKDDPECLKFLKEAVNSIDASNDVIRPSAYVDPLPLAKQVWQDLWTASGAPPEICLYAFVEIFIFKYLSDLGLLTGSFSFSHLREKYSTDDENAVLEIYVTTVRPKIKSLFPASHIDKTTIINGTIFVSKDEKAVSGYSSVFRTILDRFASFGTLSNIDYDFKSKLFETFLKESKSKENWGQFFTPLKVVRSIVSMADIREGMSICDPACGVGKFLLEPVSSDIRRFFEVKDGKIVSRIKLYGFDKGFDKEEQKTIILAKANMLIYISAMIKDNPQITSQFSALFNETFLLQTNSILGTLANPVIDKYDLILTNPPFVTNGSSNLKKEISKHSELATHYAVGAMGIEGLFMEWIVRALKPEGKVFMVVPDGIMNRANDKRLRDFILDECYVDAVISLPLNTFFTTSKKTYIIALTKKALVTTAGIPTKKRQLTPVFTYLCSEIGETRDIYRFDIEQNDLDVAASSYNMFKGSPGRFTTNDKRCKIEDIDKFYNSSHWSVDRWWSHEEKIGLGIENENITVNINQFVSIISDIAASICEYQEPLLEIEKQKTSIGKLKQIYLLDENIFGLVSTVISLNRTKLASINTDNNLDIPVYTAGKEPVAYIKAIKNKFPIDATADHPLLSFATNGDGSAGRNFVIHTRPFYINADRLAVYIKDKNLSLQYLHTQLSDMKDKYKFSHSNKANKHNLGAVTINVPIDEDGNFDIAKQTAIAEQFTLLTDLRKELAQRYLEVESCNVLL
jgi:type I restriction-modification system DNA methylase subunit